MWYMVQRTGVDLSKSTPAEVSSMVFARPKAQLEAMRAGAFFVLADEYSEGSEVFRTLTQTNIGIPIEQCFRADMTCMQGGADALPQALARFVTYDRLQDAYLTTRANFASGVLNLNMASSVASAVSVFAASGVFTSPAMQQTIKNLVGNVQILANVQFAFGLSWPREMTDFVRYLKVFALDIMSLLNLKCSLRLEGYTYRAGSALVTRSLAHERERSDSLGGEI